MSPILLFLIGQAADILIKAVIRKPDLEIHIAPIIQGLIPLMSQVAGETPEETKQRQDAAEAIFKKHEVIPG